MSAAQKGPFGIHIGTWRAMRDVVRAKAPAALDGYRAIRTEVHGVFARINRRRCRTYIGVTGSCGKSTATYLIGQLLAGQGTVEAVVQRNMRSAVFRSLAHVKKPIDYMVQEISGHHPGAIKLATKVARPDIAVVTTVGNDHSGRYRNLLEDGDTKGDEAYLSLIAAEKGDLVASLRAAGIACLNADDPLVREMSRRAPGQVVFYGTADIADVRAENVKAGWPARMSFDLVIGPTRRRVQTQFVGTLMLGPVLASLSAVHAVNGDIDQAVEALATVTPLARRMDVRPGTDGHSYIIDTVKAPLWQVELLIDDLPNLRPASIVFVLGEVSDMRTDNSAHYRRLLRKASEVADHVVGFGRASSSAKKVRSAGADNVVGLETYDATVAHLATLSPGVVILKSNKTAKLARVWEAVAPDGQVAASG